ncbi:MAG: DUF3971 domain-containing protein, partial [Pseudomonadota bacterium]
VDQEELLRNWPTSLTPKTRGWLDRNVLAGTLSNIQAAARIKDGAPPVFGVSYEFAGASVRYLPKMPVLEDASGRASLRDKRFVIALDSGRIQTPQGDLGVGGSVFAVPDTDDTPSTIELDLSAQGPVGAALSLLSNPPIGLLDETAFGPEDFSGQISAQAELSFLSGRDPTLAELGLSGSGRLTAGASDTLVPGRSLEADALDLVFTGENVSVAGDLTVDNVPVTATWRRPIGRQAPPGNGRVEGTTIISPEAISALALQMPPGTISGSSDAAFEIELPEDGVPLMRLTSNLAGLGLAIPPAGWSKPDPVAGRFETILELGDAPRVTSMSLNAPGLDAENIRVALTEDRRLSQVSIPRLRLEDWLDAAVTVTSRGPNVAPALRIDGGTLDIRGIAATETSRTTAVAGPDKGPVTLTPDRVVISDGITLTGFRGQLRPGAGVSGQFTAAVNGGTEIFGGVIPVNNGTAIRIQSNNAGGVVRDAGFLKNGQGGTLDLILSPTTVDGNYTGELLMEQVTVRDAPALAALLDAISIVGLLDDGGTGIRFDTVDARFLLTPTQLRLRRSAAVGASMGISMDGIYDLGSNQMDMQGVVSPLYVLNGIGSILTRRGEGLFGFNFRMTGPARSPRIAMNPLSIFTPGMFREIFRRPPPRIDERAPTQ